MTASYNATFLELAFALVLELLILKASWVGSLVYQVVA